MVPAGGSLALDHVAETGTPGFLDRREMGIVNIGAPARVIADGQTYPMATGDGDVPWGELHVGAVGTFRDAGFREVSRPTPRRHVMRIDLRAAADAMPHPSGR